MIIKKLVKNLEDQTVFGLSEIARVTGKPADKNLISAVSYYVKKGDLIRLAKGLYSFDKSYSAWELGNRLRSPSYISLNTVLQDRGVNFQPYTSIFLVANRNEIRTIKGQKYIYRKIKDEILLNLAGIEVIDGVAVAILERAILDKIYLDGPEHFDNLRAVDWDKMDELNRSVYQRKNITKYIKEMRQDVGSKIS
jgi:predicted transcriptional regulator of viral defense system